MDDFVFYLYQVKFILNSKSVKREIYWRKHNFIAVLKIELIQSLPSAITSHNITLHLIISY